MVYAAVISLYDLLTAVRVIKIVLNALNAVQKQETRSSTVSMRRGETNMHFIVARQQMAPHFCDSHRAVAAHGIRVVTEFMFE